MNIDIVIPTYNRKRELIKTVVDICSLGLPYDVKLHVLDNCSSYDVRAKLKDNLPLDIFEKIKVHVNKSNIGMSANILRAFECGSFDYIYIVADDDDIEDGFIERILEVIKKYPSADVIKLSSNRSSVISCSKDLVDVCKNPKEFNSHIFLSNVIYKRASVMPFLNYGYESCDSYVPHFIMLYMMLREGKILQYIDQSLVTYVVPKIGYNYALIAGLGVGGLKRFLIGESFENTKEFHGIFYPHNDYKVLIDLRYQCMVSGSLHDYVYLSSHYNRLVAPHRSKIKNFAIRSLSVFLKYEPLFKYMLSFKFIPSEIKAHLQEISIRYEKAD